MEISKSWSKLSDKMNLKGVISKKQQIFGLCHFFEKKSSFLEITPFRCILSLSFDPIFGISVKLRIF